MLYRKIIALCSEIHAKHINIPCGLNVALSNVKPGGTYSNLSSEMKYSAIPNPYTRAAFLDTQYIVKPGTKANPLNKQQLARSTFRVVRGNSGKFGLYVGKRKLISQNKE